VAEVVCAHIIFFAKQSEADFASDCTNTVQAPKVDEVVCAHNSCDRKERSRFSKQLYCTVERKREVVKAGTEKWEARHVEAFPKEFSGKVRVATDINSPRLL
jgi:hypothetical protein